MAQQPSFFLILLEDSVSTWKESKSYRLLIDCNSVTQEFSETNLNADLIKRNQTSDHPNTTWRCCRFTGDLFSYIVLANDTTNESLMTISPRGKKNFWIFYQKRGE